MDRHLPSQTVLTFLDSATAYNSPLIAHLISRQQRPPLNVRHLSLGTGDGLNVARYHRHTRLIQASAVKECWSWDSTPKIHDGESPRFRTLVTRRALPISENCVAYGAHSRHGKDAHGSEPLPVPRRRSMNEERTEPYNVSVGISPLPMTGGLGRRPDLNGIRVKSPAGPEVWLIVDGVRRWIPNPTTYNNLFRDWTGIVVDINAPQITQGDDLSDGAILAKGAASPHVYLVSNGSKRWITSPAVMDKYHFSWGRIYVVPEILLASIAPGPDIS